MVEVLKLQRSAARTAYPDCPWVFHLAGERLQLFHKSWRTASKAAGPVDGDGKPTRLFHDLLRSAVRNLVRARISEQVSMKISGHKSLTVFEGYNVTSEADIRQGAVKLAAYMAELDENAVLEIGTLLAHWRY